MAASKKKYGAEDTKAIAGAGLKMAGDYFSGKDASAYGEKARRVASAQRTNQFYKDVAKKKAGASKPAASAPTKKKASAPATPAKKKASSPAASPMKKVPSLPIGVAGNAMFRKMNQSAPEKKKAGAAKVTPQKRLYGS